MKKKLNKNLIDLVKYFAMKVVIENSSKISKKRKINKKFELLKLFNKKSCIFKSTLPGTQFAVKHNGK